MGGTPDQYFSQVLVLHKSRETISSNLMAVYRSGSLLSFQKTVVRNEKSKLLSTKIPEILMNRLFK